MRRFYVGFVLLVALGLAGGYLLVPGRTEMALMLLKNKEFAAARAEYEALIEAGEVNVRTVMPLTRLYRQSGDVDRAIAVMEQLIDRNPDNVRFRERLATYYQYAQRPSDYRRNLQALIELEPTEARLRQLADIHNFNGRYEAQVDVLERLLDRGEGRPEDYRALGYLHARLGEPAAGADHLRQLQKRGGDVFRPVDRRLLVSLLLDEGRYAEALPLIEAVLNRGGVWREYYVRALKGEGDTQRLLAYWESRLAKGGLTQRETLDIAFEFLDAGRKQRAEEVLFGLASGAPPDSQVIQQLLFLWGPRPGEKAVAWISERARASSGRARQLWLRHLRGVGALDEARDIRLAGLTESENPIEDVRALADAGETAALAEAIRRALDQVTTVEELRVLGQTAKESFLGELAHQAYARILEDAPDDSAALRFEGIYAYRGGELERAQRLLERYLRLAEGDYEVFYVLGEVHLSRGQPGRSQSLFRRALERLEGVEDLDRRQQVVRAQSLHRTGRSREAIMAYRDLVDRYSEDRHLRADYVLLLMEKGRLDEARRVLEEEG